VAYCTKCGTEELDDQRFCTVCGAPKAGSVYASAMPPISSQELTSEAQVRVGIALEPPRQSRWTVLFRLFMAIPLFVVAFIVAIASFFCTVAAWFCALVTGRVPDGLQEFNSSALRLYANVGAYVWLLSPRWPGICFAARPDDQLTLDIDHVDLRRSSVFFRIILGYPASIVSSVLAFGTYLVVLVVWIVALIMGRAPRALHQALALVLRFEIRQQAYMSLLTPTQPFRGLFGDATSVGGPTPLDSTTPLATPSLTSQLNSGGITPGLFPEPVATTSSVAVTAPPTRWVVTKAAKNLVVIFIVLGALMYVVSNVVSQPLASRMEKVFARSIVDSSHAQVVSAMSRFALESTTCASSGDVTCYSTAAQSATTRLGSQFPTVLVAALVPVAERADARVYADSITTLKSELTQITNSLSLTIDQSIIDHQLTSTLSQLNASYARLHYYLG